MCGRYTLTKNQLEIEEHFDATMEIPPEEENYYNPNYNVAPTNKMPVITNQNPHAITFYQWGLVPFWTDDPKTGYKMINARAETIREKKTFKKAFEKQRCLVVADGFYEWKKSPDKKTKQPYRITLQDEPLFAFAGLYEYNKKLDLHSYTIITTDANELVQDLHDRMPAILKKEDYHQWLLEENPDEVYNLLQPFDPASMKMYPVDKRVNAVNNNDRDLLEPVDPLI